ncbi:hypothetical protein NFI96_007551 [Prochilodus magdalenae]|nr:hypothetical protein NFI96_007551 [Prochilodus magdalenae]
MTDGESKGAIPKIAGAFKIQNTRDKLFFLEQYTSGEPQDLDRSVKMPSNRSHAEQRAINLKKKLNKNSEFHIDYKTFMHDIIARGYAEKVA